MLLEEIRKYCLCKSCTTEETPFGPDVLVFKVMNKMFALLQWTKQPLSINLKCDPEQALVLRAMYPAVTPGYHMNKKHWNTVLLDGSVDQDLFLHLLNNSYQEVIKGLTKKQRLTVVTEQARLDDTVQ